MRSKSKIASQMDANPYHISPSVTCSEPWWRNTNYNSISPAVIGGNASNSSLMEQSKNGQSQSDGELGESDDDAINESQITASPHSGIDGNYGLDHQNSQPQTSAIPPSNESLTQPPQLELVGHSIACASNPYSYPYYGGMMAAYGPQPWVPPPHLLDIYHGRMPLPLEMAQEPVYVNAKQYHGILRRRQLRAKAEAEKKLIKARKPYLHESRHQHAMRRARVSGGRFAKKSNIEDLKCPAEKTGPGSAIPSHSASSSGSEPLRCETVDTRNHHESKGHEVQETYGTQGYADDNVQYQSHNTYGAHPTKGGGGDPSDQQWGNVSSNKASQRALAVKGKRLCPT